MIAIACKSASGETLAVARGEDEALLCVDREYRDGDDIRNVHWRLSSKLDSLMVKEFSKPLDERCSVLIETSLCGIEDPEEIKQKTDRILSEIRKTHI